MRRRVIRERKEFLEKKQNEKVHQMIALQKQQFRDATQSNSNSNSLNVTQIPSHLKKDALLLKKMTELDDEETRKNKLSGENYDDEYMLAGLDNPRVLVTTSREPSQKLLEFAKEIKLVIPNSERINRGHYAIDSIMESAKKNNYTDVVMINESGKGTPDTLIVSHLPLGPTLYFSLTNIIARHDIENCGTMSEQYPHLIFENFSTPLGRRVATALKYLFPIPKETATRVITFDNENDFISFRHHTFENRNKQKKLDASAVSEGQLSRIELTEVGPRFELTPFKIMQGTLDMKDAEIEWSLRPYMNTSKKRRLL